MRKKVSIMCPWCGWENPSPRLRAALRPMEGFSHPHQEHMKDTHSIKLFLGYLTCG